MAMRRYAENRDGNIGAKLTEIVEMQCCGGPAAV
jgi:hypothetical protein